MHHQEPGTDRQTCEAGGGGMTGRQQDDKHEHEGKDDLGEERSTGLQADHRVDAPAIGAEPGRRAAVGATVREYRPQRERAGDATDQLRGPIAGCVLQRRAAGDHEAQRDRGIDMTSRDRADRVDQRDQHEPERERSHHHPGCGAAALQMEPERQCCRSDREEHEDCSAQ